MADEALWLSTGAISLDLGELPYPRAKGVRYILNDLKKRLI